jgi:signal transduction histidine kinase
VRRLICCGLVVCGLAAGVRADEVQEARERARGLLDRSTALAATVSTGLRPGQPASEIFAALLRLAPRDGSNIGVFDQDGRRIAWLGTPIDPLLLPEVDPAMPVTLVAATKSRASLIVTAKASGPWFVLVSTPLLETRRVGPDRVEVVDVLDPGRTLGLDYSDRSPAVTPADHASERIVVSGITFAKVPAHTPAIHARPSETPSFPAGAALLASLFAATAASAFRFARGSFADRRAFLLTLTIVLAAVPVAALFSELSVRRAEREATLLEIRSIIRAHRTPLEVTLRATEAEIDRAALFETSPAGRFGTEELAFDLWSDSPLAQPLLPSFVEVLDRSGAVVSRYGRDIQRGPKPGLPASGAWTTSPISLPEGDGLLSERLLFSSGELLGGVRVGVVSDLNLAFRSLAEIKGIAFREVRDARGAVLEDPTLLTRADGPSESGRIVVPVDGRTYVFNAPVEASALSPRVTGARMLGWGLGLVITGLLVGAWTGNAARTRKFAESLFRRHSFRLFFAFLTLSALSLFFFQTLVRDFVAQRLVAETETEARRIAAIARKSLGDLSAFQEAEVLGSLAISDAAVTWVATLVSNDLELFDDSGALVATNVREDVEAGLLSRLAPADAYSRLVLNDEDMLFHRPPGSLVPSAVSARLVLPAGRAGLVRVNLQNREAQVAAVLTDLDTRMRLAALSLLAVATMLAWLLARRISGPVLEITGASRRIASGDLAVRVPVRTTDEVGELARSFNTMAEDLARQQHEIERRERLAAWADMAAQVAHEVKNPLTPIQLSTEHLQRAYKASGIHSGAFEKVMDVCTHTILESVVRLRDIASEFAAFVGAPTGRRQRVDLAELARSVIAPYEDVLPERVRLSTDFSESCPALGEAKLVERAIRNLLENALQAVGGAGEIRVVARRAAGFVELTVEDSGPGFDDETRAHLFEPFFSTKTQGSGLGLALVKKVAEDLGGTASLDRDGGLTRATFRLPLASDEA